MTLDFLQQPYFSILLSYLILLVLIRVHFALNPDLNLIWNRQVVGRTDSITVFSVQPWGLWIHHPDIPGELILSTRSRVSSAVKEHPHLTGRVPTVCLKITRSVSKRKATTTDESRIRLALSWPPCHKWRICWNPALPKCPFWNERSIAFSYQFLQALLSLLKSTYEWLWWPWWGHLCRQHILHSSVSIAVFLFLCVPSTSHLPFYNKYPRGQYHLLSASRNPIC